MPGMEKVREAPTKLLITKLGNTPGFTRKATASHVPNVLPPPLTPVAE